MPEPERVSITKLPTGGPGMDQILGGGLVEYSCNVIVASSFFVGNEVVLPSRASPSSRSRGVRLGQAPAGDQDGQGNVPQQP